jgi:hypothetical protein
MTDLSGHMIFFAWLKNNSISNKLRSPILKKFTFYPFSTPSTFPHCPAHKVPSPQAWWQGPYYSYDPQSFYPFDN